MKFEDLSGQVFGRLTVITRDGGYKPVRWVCQCACGEICSIRAGNLKSGNVKSCGCLRRETMGGIGGENLLPNNEAIINGLFARYKRSAYLRGLEWRLTLEDFKAVIFQSCAYHGGTLSHVTSRINRPGQVVCNGIDRVDSSLGYTPSNIVAACWECNRMKGAKSTEEFKAHISQIYEHLHAMKCMKVGA